MTHPLVIASLDRAGDHAVVLGVLVAVAAVGGLAYGLFRLVVRSRAARTRSDRRPGGTSGPEA